MKKIIPLWLVAFLVMFSLTQAIAQSKSLQVTGRVTSSTEEKPLTGVSISLKGAMGGATTDADGRFVISLPSSSGVLIFS